MLDGQMWNVGYGFTTFIIIFKLSLLICCLFDLAFSRINVNPSFVNFNFDVFVFSAKGRVDLTSTLLLSLPTCLPVPRLDGSTSAPSHPPGCPGRRVRNINLKIYVTPKEIRSNLSFLGNLT